MSACTGVLRVNGEFRLLSLEPMAKGSTVLTIVGHTTSTPTRHSLQIGPSHHIDVTDIDDPLELMDVYFWRFLNHHCEPNLAINGIEVIAIREIAAWEELTFNYNTTEFELIEPFDCRCGSPICGGRIRGFVALSEPERSELMPWVAPHLKSLVTNGDSGPEQTPTDTSDIDEIRNAIV